MNKTKSQIIKRTALSAANHALHRLQYLRGVDFQYSDL